MGSSLNLNLRSTAANAPSDGSVRFVTLLTRVFNTGTEVLGYILSKFGVLVSDKYFCMNTAGLTCVGLVIVCGSATKNNRITVYYISSLTP
jgi:hypothetical protein